MTGPDSALGSDWRKSSDVLVAGAGDSRGFHLYTAREKDAFAWSTLATLTDPALDLGPWIGEVCVTGSGRFAVAVFAPAVATNKPALMEAGAIAAVVDVATGKAQTVATGVQLAYFNPACGPGDRALLTRAIGVDMQQTDLLTVDAAAGKVVSTRRINAQLTTPAPAPDGDYGIAYGALVRVDQAGALTTVAQPQGRPFAVQATAHNGIDVASVGDKQAIVERHAGGQFTQVAAGPRDNLQLLSLKGGGNAIVGTTSGVKPNTPELTVLSSDRRVQAVSAQGHLLAVDVLARQVAQAAGAPLTRPDPRAAGAVQVTVRATRTGHTSTGEITTTQAPTLNAITGSATAFSSATPSAVAPKSVKTAADGAPYCAVPRNDPSVQAFQPSPDMVEWAVDQAVHDQLTVVRPANYLKTGMGSYSPQGYFPRASLTGGGTVPAQILLGILAQESNLSEASQHAVPGDLGNPLIADYYGNKKQDIDLIDYPHADCGYGIGQVTTGMHAGDQKYTWPQQVAIATDYAANIAASMNILIEKWNQTFDPRGRTWVNNGNPAFIENWFIAVWAYNSGFHPSSEAGSWNGRWGIGWLNNPANPIYLATRKPFLRDGYGDAAHPERWSYPEKIMGWAETPQRKGGGSAYASPAPLHMPDPMTFCSKSINSCDPGNTANPCPALSEACWWSGHADFANCAAGECAVERLTHGAGAPEPGVKRVYDRSCDRFTGQLDDSKDATQGSLVVYDLNDAGQYALGCGTQPTDGKFTLRLGHPAGNPLADRGQIDLHQLGAGYQGHIWFTHVYPPNVKAGGIDGNKLHQVVGTWTPNLPLGAGRPTQRYDIVVHLPSHGGEYKTAGYVIVTKGVGGTTATCEIDQGTGTIVTNGVDKWVYLGNYELGQGARVMLNNIGGSGADGTTDIAFDAMAFVPLATTQSGKGHNCKNEYK